MWTGLLCGFCSTLEHLLMCCGLDLDQGKSSDVYTGLGGLRRDNSINYMQHVKGNMWFLQRRCLTFMNKHLQINNSVQLVLGSWFSCGCSLRCPVIYNIWFCVCICTWLQNDCKNWRFLCKAKKVLLRVSTRWQINNIVFCCPLILYVNVRLLVLPHSTPGPAAVWHSAVWCVCVCVCGRFIYLFIFKKMLLGDLRRYFKF